MLLDALTTVTTLAARLPEPVRAPPPPSAPPPAPRRKRAKPPAAWALLLAALAPFLGQMQGRM